MLPILNTNVRPSLVRFCRLSFPALVLGLCALTCLQQDALGQAQMGAAETCFDSGPDKLPALPGTSVPAVRAGVPARIAQLLQPVESQPARNHAARPAHTLSKGSHPGSGGVFRKKAPEGTLTAAR